MSDKILKGRFVQFSAEFPDGNPDAWFVNFDPSLLNSPMGSVMKTNATISLRSPPNAQNPIQSTVIKIKMVDYWVFGDTWFVENTSQKKITRVVWPFFALILGFGKYSGKVLPTTYYAYLSVKVKAFHDVDIEALPLQTIKPNQAVSIPISVRNLGNYNDTFGFRINGDYGPIDLITPVTISLTPGETADTYLAIASPNVFLDTGTLRSVTVEAYSIDQPNVTIGKQRIALETQGVYLSQMNGTFVGILFIFILIVAFFIWLRRKRRNVQKGKPQKSWTIPEERQYLEELKHQDKKAYEKEQQMMEDEYKSALLWFKYYKEAMKREAKKKPEQKKEKKPKKETKKLELEPKEKTKGRLNKFFKRSKEKPAKKEEIIEKPVVALAPPEKKLEEQKPQEIRNKEKTLQRIQREQEKQKKRLKK